MNDPQRYVDDYTRRFVPRFSGALLLMWSRQQKLINNDDDISIIATRYQDLLVEATNRDLAKAWRQGLAHGHKEFSYEEKDSDEDWLRVRQGVFLIEMRGQFDAAIQSAIQNGLDKGLNPRQVARMMKGAVPLTQRQQTAANRVLNALLANGVGKDAATKQVARYQDRMKHVRAERIARTEMMAANNMGAFLEAKALIGNGTVGGFRRIFWTAVDERVCNVCGPLHGQVYSMNEVLVNNEAVPPIHPSCRCILLYEVIS